MTGCISNEALEALRDLCREVFRPVPGSESKITASISAMCSQEKHRCHPSASNMDEEFCRLADELSAMLDDNTYTCFRAKARALWDALKEDASVERGCKALAFLTNEKQSESLKTNASVLPAFRQPSSVLSDVPSILRKPGSSTPLPGFSSAASFQTPGLSTVAEHPTSTKPTVDRFSAGQSKMIKESVQTPEYQDPLDAFPSEGGSVSQALVNICMGYESSMFKLDPKTKLLRISEEYKFDPPLRSLAYHLGKIGYWHNIARVFVDKALENGNPPTRRALATSVMRYLTQFYNQVRLADTPPTEEDPEERKLKRLTFWFEPCGEKMRVVAEIVSNCEDLKGGVLLSRVHRFVQTGDSCARKVCYDILNRCCVPFYDALYVWLAEGKLHDATEEFFIGEKSDVTWDSGAAARLDNWWSEKYFVRWEQVPVFLRGDIVQHALAVGKNVVFVSKVSRQVNPISGMKELLQQFKREITPESLFLEGHGEMGCMRDMDENLFRKDTDYIGTIIHNLFVVSSSYVYNEVILKECGLVEELTRLRYFILLGSGEFAHSMINWMRSVLDMPAVEMTIPLVRCPLENAIREVTTHLSFSKAGTQRMSTLHEKLDVRLFDANGQETGWDIFVLYYRIDGPLGTIITREHLTYYSQLFRCLWKMQRTSFISRKLWMELKNARKLYTQTPEITGVIRDILSLVSAMMHLTTELYFFLSLEVIEIEWCQMMADVQAAESLDMVCAAHKNFLESIFAREFLRDMNRGMFPKLRSLQNLILRLYPIVKNFIDAAVMENERRIKFVAAAKPQVPPKKPGLGGRAPSTSRRQISMPKIPTPAKLTDQEKVSRLAFQSAYVEPCRNKVRVLRSDFMRKMCEFLLELSNDAEGALLPLGMRLDFNEFYAKLDRRLGTPLMFRNQRERQTLAATSLPRNLANALLDARRDEVDGGRGIAGTPLNRHQAVSGEISS